VNDAPAIGGSYAAEVEHVVERVMDLPVEQVPQAAAAATAAGDVNRHMQQVDGVPTGDSLDEILRKIKTRVLEGGGIQKEHEDRHHRMGRLLVAAHTVFEQRPRRQGFYDWLDAMPEWERVTMLSNAMKETAIRCLGSVAQNKWLDKNRGRLDQQNLHPSVVKAFLRGVAYLDEKTRPSYRVDFRAGQAFYQGKLLDTTKMRTVFSGQGFGIWVLDPAGNFYAANHVLGQMHHSSFLSGGDIKAGGELKVKNGRIEFLSGKSGHYKPEMANLLGTLSVLQFQGVAVDGVRVLVWKKGNTRKPLLVSGTALMATHSQYELWGGMSDQDKQNLQLERWAAFGQA